MNYHNCFLWQSSEPNYSLDQFKESIEHNDKYDKYFHSVFNQTYRNLSYEMIDYLFEQEKIKSTIIVYKINNRSNNVIILNIYPFIWLEEYSEQKILNSIYITYKIICILNDRNAFYTSFRSVWNSCFITNESVSSYPNFFTFIKEHDCSMMHPALKKLASNEKKKLQPLSKIVFKKIYK